MDSDRSKSQSLSRKIFRSVSAFTIVVILVFAAVLSAIFFSTYENDAEQELIAQAQDAATYLNKTPSSDNASALQDQFAGEIRYTLIAPDGTVLYDSYGSADDLENHADRPEVRQAETVGQATAVRYSATLQTDTVYAAVKLEDGSIIRLAETRHSVLSFLSGLIWPIIIALAIAVVMVFLLSNILTKRIMKPIDALDFSHPLKNEIYEEMNPFLERFQEQQELLLKQNEELAQAESMRRDFSSNVSHEMKTPLQVISGYAELLKNDMIAPEDRQKSAELIYEEAQTMRKLIDDILVLSRLDESTVIELGEEIDLHDLAKRAASRLSSFARSHGITISVEGESACIMGNATLAQEMLYNLIENGIRYNHPNGTVVVLTEQAKGEVIVSVTDTGPGMAEDMKDKIFERFFRIDKSRSKETGGTGLGLAIVKHAVLYHKGTIEVESTLGIGTAFTLRFLA